MGEHRTMEQHRAMLEQYAEVLNNRLHGDVSRSINDFTKFHLYFCGKEFPQAIPVYERNFDRKEMISSVINLKMHTVTKQINTKSYDYLDNNNLVMNEIYDYLLYEINSRVSALFVLGRCRNFAEFGLSGDHCELYLGNIRLEPTISPHDFCVVVKASLKFGLKFENLQLPV